ncbi:hypothetical protein [Jongsikchunia kroppenstedtii]|uniref:hypothetical protein n=1 Tax=Jongsikchunia kroppenstedtii TaxID=1121721 RepID=UPI00036FF24B|nr:hypothetical protein [Jongsikchunia kroppenstedtii]
MAMFRLFWLLLAGAAVALAMWAGTWPAEQCGPIPGGDLPERCSASNVRVLGVWPVIGLGVALVMPAAVAAAVMRISASWLAVAAYGVMPFVGIFNWWNYWGTLLCAIPLFLLGALFAFLQQLIATDDGAESAHESGQVTEQFPGSE